MGEMHQARRDRRSPLSATRCAADARAALWTARWTLALLAGWLAGPTPALAQSLDTRGPGIAMGRVTFFPSLTLDYDQDRNVFYTSTELPQDSRIDSGLVVVKPRLLVDLPFARSRVRWAYSPTYRDYTSDRFRQSERLSHFFDFEGSLLVGERLQVRPKDHLVRGTTELQEIDPGGELTFGLVPFFMNEAEAGTDLMLGPRQSVSVIPRYAKIHMDQQGGLTLLESRTEQIEGRYNYQLGQETELSLSYNHETTRQERNLPGLGEVMLDARTVGVSLRRTLNQAVVAQVLGGYEDLAARGGLGTDFAGAVLDGSAVWQVTDVSRVEIAARRLPYQSFFANSDYYIDTSAAVKLTHQVGRAAFWQAGATYRWNRYPEAIDVAASDSLAPSNGTRRSDRIWQIDTGVGCQLRQSLRLFVGYNAESRQSNVEQQSGVDTIDPFHYTVGRLVFRIEAGWL